MVCRISVPASSAHGLPDLDILPLVRKSALNTGCCKNYYSEYIEAIATYASELTVMILIARELIYRDPEELVHDIIHSTNLLVQRFPMPLDGVLVNHILDSFQKILCHPKQHSQCFLTPNKLILIQKPSHNLQDSHKSFHYTNRPYNRFFSKWWAVWQEFAPCGWCNMGPKLVGFLRSGQKTQKGKQTGSRSPSHSGTPPTHPLISSFSLGEPRCAYLPTLMLLHSDNVLPEPQKYKCQYL
jgi:hypothetical protein